MATAFDAIGLTTSGDARPPAGGLAIVVLLPVDTFARDYRRRDPAENAMNAGAAGTGFLDTSDQHSNAHAIVNAEYCII
jgi:hypothetical protein